MNVRQCVEIKDKKSGVGYRMVSRELMLYLDPETGEILRKWDNPWTGKKNDIIHVANDPVNGRPDFGIDKNGKEKSFNVEILNDSYFINFEIPLYYPNAMGGAYHSAEIFDFSGNSDEFLDASRDIEYANIAWVRIAKWLPWMNIGDRPGIMYFNAVGKKLENWDELPEILKAEIATNYPEYTNAPPLDDARPNETLWTYMKKIIDERRATAKGKD